ncbi:MAG: uroporphyrinogen decarboxylase family protein [Nitrososphaerota archaeon]
MKSIRENVMAVFHHEPPERIPWLTYDIPYPMLPRGSWERELRNMGLGIIGLMGFYPCGDVYVVEMPNVEIEQRISVRGKRKITTTIYHTPIGSIIKKEDLSIGPPNPWIIEYPFKGPSDYDIIKFIIEDMEYTPNYESFLWIDKHVGDDGYVRAGCRSPFQSLLLDWMGYKTLFIELHKNRREIEKILNVMEKKYFELIKIFADSPVEVISIDGNINGRVTNPKLFERYLLPVYKKASDILHSKGKIVSAHMDGALKCLKDLIPKTGLDVVEAFTPPPLGDLPLSEAREEWGEKIIISANFPETVCLNGVEAIKQYTLEILKTVAPGDAFMLTVTEDIPYKEPNDLLEISLRTITKIMYEYGRYPVKIP